MFRSHVGELAYAPATKSSLSSPTGPTFRSPTPIRRRVPLRRDQLVRRARRAIDEMTRVVRPGGKVVSATRASPRGCDAELIGRILVNANPLTRTGRRSSELPENALESGCNGSSAMPSMSSTSGSVRPAACRPRPTDPRQGRHLRSRYYGDTGGPDDMGHDRLAIVRPSTSRGSRPTPPCHTPSCSATTRPRVLHRA